LVLESSWRDAEQRSLLWPNIFQGTTLGDRPVEVEQAVWSEVDSLSAIDGTLLVDLKPARVRELRPLAKTVRPDLVLMRSVTRSVFPLDSRRLFYGISAAQVPCVNSLTALQAALERPVMHGGLIAVQRKLGKGYFEVVNSSYYPDAGSMKPPDNFPCVVKLGACHSGYGKIKCENEEDFDGARKLVEMHKEYCTIEPFVEHDHEIRVQKLGEHYRVYKVTVTSDDWKGNKAKSKIFEDVAVEDVHRNWADECSTLFGGMEILGFDAVHRKSDGVYVILEINDTAIGLLNENQVKNVKVSQAEEMGFIRDACLRKLEASLLPGTL